MSTTTPTESQTCCNDAWEEAYRRFETPDEEVRKFLGRLRWLGAKQWDRGKRVVEIFCGRGNGLVALERLGFERLEGVDLSGTLLEQYTGPASCVVADCRSLPFEDDSRDVIVVQGGLHHLPTLPDDLDRVLDEVRRVLVPGGRFVVVEPWNTPFLRAVHWACDRPLLRRAWSKLDALAVMTENEIDTYTQWLERPDEILASLTSRFETERHAVRWGKLYFVGAKAE